MSAMHFVVIGLAAATFFWISIWTISLYGANQFLRGQAEGFRKCEKALADIEHADLHPEMNAPEKKLVLDVLKIYSEAFGGAANAYEKSV